MAKNPVVAAVLNFFTSPPVTSLIPSVWPFLLAGLITLKVGLAIDGYNEAKAANG